MIQYISSIEKIKPEQIEDQIEIREELIGEMVGNLYPAILRNEIKKLKALRDDFINEREVRL
jgi:hypothetical protein